MAARRSIPDLEAENQKLREQLEEARQALVDIVSDEARALIEGYYRVGSRRELYSWEHGVVEQLLELADAEAFDSVMGARACCPLCGRGSSAVGPEGFSMPEGLRRHLAGHGHVQRCSVLHAAMVLARGYFDRKFGAAELAARWLKPRLSFCDPASAIADRLGQSLRSEPSPAIVNDPQQVRGEHDLLLGLKRLLDRDRPVRVRVLVRADRAGKQVG
jgi:hypothetical protein